MRIALNFIASIGLILFSANNISYLITGRSFDESSIYQLVYGFDAVNWKIFGGILFASIMLFILTIFTLLYFNRVLELLRIGIFKWIFVAPLLIIYIFTNSVTDTIAKAVGAYWGPESVKTNEEYENRFKSVARDVVPTRNVVFIYLESFERTFFDSGLFPGLVPNLSRLEKSSDHFINIEGLTSAEWTVGGMVASQCGVPLVTPIGSSNSMGRVGSFLPGAFCLGDFLSRNGYQLEYLGGAPKEFAGKDKFYLSHGFNVVSGLNELHHNDEPKSEWGRYDEYTLGDVLDRYKDLLSTGKNFGLFALTLDTHAPNGFLSPLCGDLKYLDGADAMLNAVHCNDRIVGKFIEDLRSVPGGEDTLIVVGSDHLSMRNTATAKLEKTDRKNLLMVFNGSSDAGEAVDSRGTTLDVGATVLDYLTEGKIDALGLGRSLRNSQLETLIKEQGSSAAVVKKIEEWRRPLLSYWKIEDSSVAGFSVDADMNVNLGKLSFIGPVLLDLSAEHANEVVLDGAQKRFADAVFGKKEAIIIDKCISISNFLNYHVGKGNICYLFVDKDGIIHSETLKEDKKYHINNLKNTSDLPTVIKERLAFVAVTGVLPENFHVTTDVFKNIDKLEVISSGFDSGDFSEILIGNQMLKYEFGRGLNIISVSKNGDLELVGSIDGCVDMTSISNRSLSNIDLKAGSYIGVVFDTLNCGVPGILSEISDRIGLEGLKNLNFRAPYVFLADNGKIIEFLGVAGEKLSVRNRYPEQLEIAKVH